MKTMFLQRLLNLQRITAPATLTANFLQHLKVNASAALTIYLQNIPTFI